ncbi:MAG: STT3 domain-containing protein [Candidatus Woesearchaeota archaeon]
MEETGSVIDRRKEDILNKLKGKETYIQYIFLAAIAYFGYYIRTLNLPLLKGQFPLALDPFVFLRYARYILEHGHLMAVDTMRFYPHGYSAMSEFRVLSHAIVYLYKILHFFNSAITLEQAHILYPPIAFVIGLIFFFLLVKKLFNWKAAIVASAFLTVLPAYLYRTMAGFSDKEAFALMCFYAGLYFFVCAFQTKESRWKYIANAVIAGMATGLMAVVWGGVSFLFLIIGLFAIILILLNQMGKKNLAILAIWTVCFFIIAKIGYPERYSLMTFLTSTSTILITVALLWGIVNLFYKRDILKIKDRLRHYLPDSMASLLMVIVIGSAAILIIKPSYFLQMVDAIKQTLLGTRGDRWSMTVAEFHQPYFTDIIGQFNWKAILLFFAGSLLLFYEAFKDALKKKSIILTAAFALFIMGVSLTRYSPSSQFNGATQISNVVFFGSMIGFAALVIYGLFWLYKNDKETYNSLMTMHVSNRAILVLVWFFIMVLAARYAIRLMLVFAPITAVLIGYASVRGMEYASKLKQDAIKIVAWLLIIFVVGSLFIGYSKIVMSQARYTGPSYNNQWQQAMAWVQGNTQEDAIFAHWWDYGYWVQTGGGRTTLSDGGNAYGHINHFVGRHVLTAPTNTEALEFLKAKNTTHLLMISDEIGKYPAFSSIGADENYDRYSWISPFSLDRSKIAETRNSTVYLYAGGTPLDDDFIYNGMLFPSGSSGVGGFFLPVSTIEIPGPNSTVVQSQKIGQPEAVLFYNGQQTKVPLWCVYINGEKITFEENENALKGCLRIMPSIVGDQTDPIGAALYLSPDVAAGLFSRLFLLGEQSPYFKLVYSDEAGMPVASYQGSQIGPLKIWEISYPDNLTIPPEYYGTSLPNVNVSRIAR